MVTVTHRLFPVNKMQTKELRRAITKWSRKKVIRTSVRIHPISRSSRNTVRSIPTALCRDVSCDVADSSIVKDASKEYRNRWKSNDTNVNCFYSFFTSSRITWTNWKLFHSNFSYTRSYTTEMPKRAAGWIILGIENVQHRSRLLATHLLSRWH